MTTTRHEPTVTTSEGDGTTLDLLDRAQMNLSKTPGPSNPPRIEVATVNRLGIDWTRHEVEDDDPCTYELRIRHGKRVIFHEENVDKKKRELAGKDIRAMIARLHGLEWSTQSKVPLIVEVIAHYEQERAHEPLMTLGEKTHEFTLRRLQSVPLQMSA